MNCRKSCSVKKWQFPNRHFKNWNNNDCSYDDISRQIWIAKAFRTTYLTKTHRDGKTLRLRLKMHEQKTEHTTHTNPKTNRKTREGQGLIPSKHTDMLHQDTTKK